MLPCLFDKEILDAIRVISVRLNLEAIDNTERGGSYWIVGGYEYATMLGALGMQFSEKGSATTGWRPAWYGNLPYTPSRNL